MKEREIRVLALVDKDFEDLELWYPILRLREEGVQVDLVGESRTTYVGKYGVPATAEFTFGEVKSSDYDGILVPGGWAPDRLRRFEEVLQLVQDFDKAEKVIGQICHAGWVLISADILKGRKVTSTPGIKDDMENSGAQWHDRAVVVDGHIVSSRRPPDLPDYMREYINVLMK